MKKLDIVHHNIIVLCMILIVLITGIFFGVHVASSTRGTDGMSILIFALAFLITAMQFVIFTQLVHLRDEIGTKENNDRQKKK